MSLSTLRGAGLPASMRQWMEDSGRPYRLPNRPPRGNPQASKSDTDIEEDTDVVIERGVAPDTRQAGQEAPPSPVPVPESRRTLAEKLRQDKLNKALAPIHPFAAFRKALGKGLDGTQWAEEESAVFYSATVARQKLNHNVAFKVNIAELELLRSFNEDPVGVSSAFLALQGYVRKSILETASHVIVATGVTQGWIWCLRSECAQGVERPLSVKMKVVQVTGGKVLVCMAKAIAESARIIQVANLTKDGRTWIEEKYYFDGDDLTNALIVNQNFNSKWSPVRFPRETLLRSIFDAAVYLQGQGVALRMTSSGVIFLRDEPNAETKRIVTSIGGNIGKQGQSVFSETLLVIIKTGRVKLTEQLRDDIVKELAITKPKNAFTRTSEFGIYVRVEEVATITQNLYEGIEVDCPSMRQSVQEV